METSAKTPKGHVRWGIGILLGTGVVVNYLDRTNISVAGEKMASQYGWSHTELGFMLSAFFWTYTLMQIPVGVLLDKLGVKWITRVGTFLWSLATIGTAFLGGFGGIAAMRMLLGITEAPAFPANSKATGYWFPLRERGLATSIFDGAAKFSNVIGVGISTWAIMNWGWRGAFVVTGLINLVFALVFWIIYRDPSEHKMLTQEEREYIVQNGAQQAGQAEGSVVGSFVKLLAQRKVWGLTLGFMAYGYTFYLFLTWLPDYMTKQMHMSMAKGGLYTVIPWIVATITDIFIGGWMVDHFIKKGYNPNKVRKTILILGMILGAFVILQPTTTNPNLQITYLSIALGGLAFSAPVGWSIPSLIAPKGMVGSVGSIMNFFNNLMGVAAPIITGYIIDKTGSFNTGFIIAGVIIIFGIFSYSFILGDINPIEL
ncbi:Major facilitator superfamily transporter [Acididesulfobacillus acetoxydans]|uniref:L-galactonate transporter n=1 Tax=Acididesulfobacillus acetoxydans TaxID=1561005 RepID=A0A8S0Y419_9FIRM|nr:MFS transporter [Acididesulfobacillus acetoxydans]CAA7602675.1 Major facilitator superfamily transporter [Acididesulfobacillus acetoxydans]CEJ09148.1 L-galactonate transporter [Acididesulfobacillus acetoxydans]